MVKEQGGIQFSKLKGSRNKNKKEKLRRRKAPIQLMGLKIFFTSFSIAPQT